MGRAGIAALGLGTVWRYRDLLHTPTALLPMEQLPLSTVEAPGCGPHSRPGLFIETDETFALPGFEP